MVVNDFDFVGISVPPYKADSPLVVDADAVLAGTASSQGFQAVPRRRLQVFLLPGGVEHAKLTKSGPLDGFETAAGPTPVKLLGIPVAKRLDHTYSV
jgi:hypothetical protein